MTDSELENWWVSSNRGEWRRWDGAREGTRKFVRLLGLSEDDVDAVRTFPGFKQFARNDWLVAWIHRDLEWAIDIGDLRGIARKTWPPRPADSQRAVEYGILS